MDLKKKIQEDLKKALKEGDTLKRSVLRMLKAEINNAEIAKKRKELNENEILEVVMKEVKKRKDAILAYKQGGREDAAKSEQKEMEILEGYLPKKLTEEKLKKIIQEVLKKTGAKNESDFGKVMGVLMPKIKGRADGAAVSVLVKKELSKAQE